MSEHTIWEPDLSTLDDDWMMTWDHRLLEITNRLAKEKNLDRQQADSLVAHVFLAIILRKNKEEDLKVDTTDELEQVIQEEIDKIPSTHISELLPAGASKQELEQLRGKEFFIGNDEDANAIMNACKQYHLDAGHTDGSKGSTYDPSAEALVWYAYARQRLLSVFREEQIAAFDQYTDALIEFYRNRPNQDMSKLDHTEEEKLLLFLALLNPQELELYYKVMGWTSEYVSRITLMGTGKNSVTEFQSNEVTGPTNFRYTRGNIADRQDWVHRASGVAHAINDMRYTVDELLSSQ